jgi:hypothetical protein
MSGRTRESQASSRGSRAMIELTFQVASRTGRGWRLGAAGVNTEWVAR